MASKASLNLQAISTELEGARRRQVNQSKLVRECEEGLAACMRSGLKATERVMRARLPRLKAALAGTEAVIAELEAAIGSLPLEPR